MKAIRRRMLQWVLAAIATAGWGWLPVHAAETPSAPIDAEAFFSAIVKIETSALPNARSAATLGSDREGTGIVIGRDGLVLTIGYLLIEADEVHIIDDRGRTLPARVVAYDTVSGLGLVRAITPLTATPLRMGDSTALTVADPVLVVNYRGRADATQAFVVARRVFTGNWEYMLDSAIFTSPPSLNWSGAALVGADGALLGVGSLILRDATETDPHLPGNMFVPVETLKPILAELLKSGHRDAPARPWLGVNADELQGRLVVVRVSPDSPADRAGLQKGDIILGIGGDSVRSQADFYRRLWARGNAGAEIPLRVLQGVDVREIRVRSIDREDYYRRKPTL